MDPGKWILKKLLDFSVLVVYYYIQIGIGNQFVIPESGVNFPSFD